MLHSMHVFKSKINLFQVSSAMANICKVLETIFFTIVITFIVIVTIFFEVTLDVFIDK